MEYHPYIHKQNFPFQNSKIILGSFPTWALTAPDSEKDEDISMKALAREKNGDITFFYGSSINQFWNWYARFVDPKIKKNDADSIIDSLVQNNIGITDMIKSCVRREKSALDKHLTKRSYNHTFFNYPKQNETLKILCTSKGVMNEMFLNSHFFTLHKSLYVNEEASLSCQSKLINKIGGDKKMIFNPIFRLLECHTGGRIECFSLPSPGSPYRRLKDFGLIKKNDPEYLNLYLAEVFDWFNS